MSTFTVTSLGKRSGLLATPILNHPEVGILGVHRIKEKPIVRDGEIVVIRNDVHPAKCVVLRGLCPCIESTTQGLKPQTP